MKDIIVNWVKEDEELLEPYEWDEDDDLEKSKEKILRNQALKNQDVLFKHKEKIANGDIRIKTFIIIYLKE